jgi:hypothetical protein
MVRETSGVRSSHQNEKKKNNHINICPKMSSFGLIKENIQLLVLSLDNSLLTADIIHLQNIFKI